MYCCIPFLEIQVIQCSFNKIYKLFIWYIYRFSLPNFHLPYTYQNIADFFRPIYFTGGNLSQILPYTKPIVRPEPSFQPPAVFDELKPLVGSKDQTLAGSSELLYNLLRCGVFSDKQFTVSIHTHPW